MAKFDVVDMDRKMWRDVVNLNLDAVFILFREAARQMMAQGRGGSLIATSSVASIRVPGPSIHYSAAKAGVNALVMSLASELGPQGINVNAVIAISIPL